MVHPSMSVEMSFSLAKYYNYKTFSIITNLETSKINHNLVENLSDFVFYSNNRVELDFPAILEIIKTNKLDVCLVVNGIDSSLYYADYLHNKLIGSPYLDLNLSKIRLNKYATSTYLASNGLPGIKSVEITHIDEVITYAQEINNLGWPIVIKPSENSASMAAFAVVHNQEQLFQTIDSTLGQSNPYYQGCLIDRLILQQFISPKIHEEFAIDFLSHNGNHYLQSIVQYQKEELPNGALINRQHKALTISEIPGITRVIEYLKSVLSTLKVHSGVTHNEIFWNKESEIYLIEVNNRMAGSGLVEQHKYCYGFNSFESQLELIRDDQTPKIPDMRVGHATVLKLYNYHNATPKFVNIEGINSESKVITFYPQKYTPNFEITNYNRADYIAAHVLLMNSCPVALEADIAELLQREKNGTLFI